MRPTAPARATLIAAALLTVLGGVARADEPQAPPTAAFQPEWYGWQTLAADAAVAATWILADETGADQLIGLGTLGYLVGTPLIHGLHGRPVTALTSVLLRVTVPMAGGIAGLLIGSAQCSRPTSEPTNDVLNLSPCAGEGIVVGFFGGMIVASLIDAARATTIPPSDTWYPHRDPPVTWTPTVVPSTSGATLGLVGRF